MATSLFYSPLTLSTLLSVVAAGLSLHPTGQILPIPKPSPPTTNVSVSQSFPPSSWLGYGLDMTSVIPIDIKSVRTTFHSASSCRYLNFT